MMGTHLLHLVARVALRLPPRQAKRVVDCAARLLPAYKDASAARAAADRLDRSGTCLSRALTIAARLRAANVVIAVNPAPGGASLGGHAWVEYQGFPLRRTDATGVEIARL